METTALITKLLLRNDGVLGDAATPVTDLRSSSQSAFGGPCNSVAARLLTASHPRSAASELHRDSKPVASREHHKGRRLTGLLP
jgi:hypothetical protein